VPGKRWAGLKTGPYFHGREKDFRFPLLIKTYGGDT